MRWLIVSAVLTWSPFARAEVVTADMLRATCSYEALPADIQKFAKDTCHTTIRAYLEYNSGMKNMGFQVPFCLAPGGSSLQGARSTFLGYLAINPDVLNNPATLVFMAAMSEVSRCK